MKRNTVFILFLCIFKIVFSVSAYAQPAAESGEIYTLVNTPVFGTLHADGDGKEITFYVTTEPVKGELNLDGDGYYSYIPKTDRKGRDYFGYRVKDADGNVSQEATVIIRIDKA